VVLGTNEDDAFLLDPLGKSSVLGKEAVAGVDRLGAGLLARRDELVGDQIRLARRRGS
jgi:hypothetical protein